MINMKSLNPWKCAVYAMVFCLLFTGVLYPVIGKAAQVNSAPKSSQDVTQSRTISVTGTADVMVAPDEVDITVGIETRNADFQRAKSENDENSKKVIEVTKKYGINSKYVQSDFIRTYPSYDYEKYNETSKVAYYNVQKRIIIKLKEIGKFEALISDLMSNEGVSIQNIEFRSTEMAKFKNEARKLAIKAAKDKAKLLTGEIGSGITKPVTINEEQIDNLSWYGSWWGGSWYGYNQPNMWASNVAVNYQNNQAGFGSGGDSGQSGETISIGQIKITARIGVVFELN
ncbi:MAG: SIMPL domain-containing protein [Clostridia bacterium]|nr:SIMPL domain-containing protein [Clostridia bacterium]